MKQLLQGFKHLASFIHSLGYISAGCPAPLHNHRLMQHQQQQHKKLTHLTRGSIRGL